MSVSGFSLSLNRKLSLFDAILQAERLTLSAQHQAMLRDDAAIDWLLRVEHALW